MYFVWKAIIRREKAKLRFQSYIETSICLGVTRLSSHVRRELRKG
jgi:hypothetical protein